MARKLIDVALLLVATILILDLAFSDVASAGYICGKVFWNVTEDPDSVGAIGVMVYAKKTNEAQGTSVATNCCGEYAFTGLDGCYNVWAIYSYLVYPLCAVSGTECEEEVETDTLIGICTDTTDVNFDLGIDCTNPEEPCVDPCPE